MAIGPIFFILLISTVSYSNLANAADRPFKTIYAFGDSYTDTGNTHSNSGPSGFMFVSNLPYGRTFFHRPTNRYSDGRLVIDFVAQSLSLPLLPPYLALRSPSTTGSVNFAVAGSTAIVHSFFSKNNMTLNITPQSISTQLGWFEKVLEGRGCREQSSTPKECEAVFDDALIWVGEIGANDYAYSFGSSVTPQSIQNLAINSVTTFLQALMKKGAKYVVVQGLPPTGCLTLSMYLAPPNDRDGAGCVGTANKQSSSHNTVLKSKVDALRQQFPHATIVYLDYYNAYLSVISKPKSHGITEPYKVCCGHSGGTYNFDYLNACGSPSASSCGTPSRYINWDGVHLTEAMNRAMASAFLNETYAQPPFTHLLAKKHKSSA
ncbi:GDSL esterase/lipase At3g48460 [Salvia hispanica]|uniref:GDSL esterase/lipase At3g48460 n=1 Tax=Salvia hispanica TaxID=49212 RepID=UPI00200952FD|nr:GDSL esterase/lipase At3g48460 [Salvia hispanica]